MPEHRSDWLTGRTVFIAENRAQRPNEFCAPVPGSGPPSSTVCPFCPGQEQFTPPAVHQVLDEQGRWQIRVVPNKYAVVMPAVDHRLALPAATRLVSPKSGAASSETPVSEPAAGAHEVIIESSRHLDRLSGLSVEELGDVLQTYVQRLLHWRADGRFVYGLVFKNQGPIAGASLAHLHSQFMALPIIPPIVEAEFHRAESAARSGGRCAYCRMIEREFSFGARIVYDESDFVAFCPFASMQPFEVWLMHKQHRCSFEDLPADELQRLAQLLHKLILRVESVVPDLAYNLLVRTSPWRGDSSVWYHWRIELLPRATPLAGFELATGMFINPLAPERAASKLRSV